MLPKPLLSLLAVLMALTIFGQPALGFDETTRPQPQADEGIAGKPVQVFDVAAGKIVKTLPNDAEFQSIGSAWIGSITGLAPQMQPGDSCSYVFRLPLEKPATIEAGGVKLEAADLFLFYCKDKPPLLLVFDGQRRPYLLLFSADIAPFLKKVGIPASNLRSFMLH